MEFKCNITGAISNFENANDIRMMQADPDYTALLQPVMSKRNPLTWGLVNSIYQCAQAQYDAIVTKDASTLYVIVG